MKATKMRNKQIYYATMQTASAQLSSLLSANLRKKYSKKSVRVKEGDSVKVIRGEFTGVDGKITKVSSADGGLPIEGVTKETLKAITNLKWVTDFLLLQNILIKLIIIE